MQTLAYQGAVNRVVRALLRTPLLSRAVGRHLITVYAVGRKSGRRYPVPVAYLEHEGGLLFGTPFSWARNLRSGEPVEVRYRGTRRVADVQVFTTEPEVVEAYAVIARNNHNFAGFNKISIEPDGTPNPDDLHEAWVDGARAFRLTLR
ncbi:hypothetical protein Ari01nite_47070 [Paractinoplanes rishiriensis]|uniref:Deazaflavin-dependent oxidoreductase (Nitroreductase family) n=1 Tax=Paractinoplanes rishiriensis TaxID=1050105 RepID=A0A919K1N7_9ACTN|nr:hypothetical protein Ari01nite_47070 [Actinoplanes rishiriensis]